MVENTKTDKVAQCKRYHKNLKKGFQSPLYALHQREHGVTIILL